METVEMFGLLIAGGLALTVTLTGLLCVMRWATSSDDEPEEASTASVERGRLADETMDL